MMAAIVLGESVLPAPGSAPAPPDARVWISAMAVHAALSILFAVILAVLIARVPSNTVLAVGIAFGVALYIVNFYGFTALFPWFAMARNWVSIVAHAIFGFTAAWAYQSLARRAPSPAGSRST
jgi:hypothetical protein